MATDPPNLHGGPQIPPQDNTKPFIRSPYNYDWKQASDATAIAPGGPSLTVQSMSDDTNLNVLMARQGLTGQFPVNPRVPMYADFSHITDYQSALEAVRSAMEGFMEFPADIRARFENNPQLLLQFMENPANLDEARKLGFVKEIAGGQGNAGGDAPPQSSVATPSGGAGAPASDGGARVSK